MKPPVLPPNREYFAFLLPFEPGIRKLALAVRKLVLEEARGSTELIYDAYNAVATGYSFTGRLSDAYAALAAGSGSMGTSPQDLGVAGSEDTRGARIRKGRGG